MKIIGAGLSRTGTHSLAKALNILNYSCVHFDVRFMAQIQAGRIEWERYDEIDAVTDVPTALFWREFYAHYPESRIVLTVRNENDWFESIERNYRDLPLKGPDDHHNGWRWPETTWYSRLMAFGFPEPNEFVYKKRYREHNKAVWSKVHPKRFLMLNLCGDDGETNWKKLCAFLRKPVPNVPFPWLNRSPR